MLYLDNAATSRFKPPSVVRAVTDALLHSANPGRGAHRAAIGAAMKIFECREAVRDLLHAPRAEVVFTKNCTEALNLAITGLLKDGGHAVTDTNQHNSVLRPLYEAERRGKITLTVLTANGAVTADALAESLTPRTSLVCLNAVSNVTGAKTDLAAAAKILRPQNIPLLVDGAQALGHDVFDMDVGGDLVAAPGHKGLHGPQGTGFLAFRKEIALAPILFGGTGTDSANLYQPIGSPDAYESGTLNTIGIAGLREGIVWTMKHQTEIREKSRTLTARLITGLSALPNIRLYTAPNDLNGVVSFNIGDLSSSIVADILNETYDIAVRAGLHCAPLVHKTIGTLKSGAVRASIGYDNTAKEIDVFVASIKEIQRGAQRAE
ncbi:MAG: aminotransferase class V-fold PLP-dependent enzyme [Clostridiales bacterium]|jgi:cysteine desulfurase family protein|nr:aminotransferase class V-fold PLP-dependent enzyme [Clostridiales bacterium]